MTPLPGDHVPFRPGDVLGFYVEDAREDDGGIVLLNSCLLYTSPSPRDATLSRMPSSA